MRRRILFLTPNLNGGGSQKVLIWILSNLDSVDYDMSLGICNHVGELANEVPEKVKIYNFDKKRVAFSIFKIIKAIKQIKPDVVISFISHLNIIVAFIRFFFGKNIKFVSRESSIISINNQYQKHPKIMNVMYKLLVNNFDKVICQSKYMKNDLIKHFGLKTKKIEVIYNPALYKRLKNTNYYSREIICTAGRFTIEKGFEDLIMAYNNLLQEIDMPELYILGDGELRNKYSKLIEMYNLQNKVFLPGFVKNVFEYFYKSKLYICTSRYEGLPNAVIEALATGTPVITYNCPGGISEIIIDNENGFLVESNNIEDLGSKIKIGLDYNWNTEKIINLTEKIAPDKIINQYKSLFNTV